ncbi:MAG: sulfatase-like hydrolase/transferase, partial [Candidatus Latescibacteria bacterium]|nr:sulfatase-like hydrolase/transferase [Candidatus Latescibacterota bacterium]
NAAIDPLRKDLLPMKRRCRLLFRARRIVATQAWLHPELQGLDKGTSSASISEPQTEMQEASSVLLEGLRHELPSLVFLVGIANPAAQNFIWPFAKRGVISHIVLGRIVANWHPRLVRECGFDDHCLWTWIYNKKGTSRYWNPTIIENGILREDVFEDRYGPDVYSDFAVDFVRRHSDQPFFLYYPMTLTHNPPHKTPDRAATANHRRGDKRGKNDDFPGMVAYMDKLVGRLVSTLDELNLREKTLIVFTTDNGSHKNYSGKVGDVVIQGGKSKMNDAGTRVPLIASWKGKVAAGQVCDDLVDFSDFLPTFASLAGVGVPTDRVIDGQSFLPSLLDKPGKRRAWAFTQFQHRQFVRDQRWKLHNDGRLYDMEQDPFEQMPIVDAEKSEAGGVQKRLQDILDSLNNSV